MRKITLTFKKAQLFAAAFVLMLASVFTLFGAGNVSAANMPTDLVNGHDWSAAWQNAPQDLKDSIDLELGNISNNDKNSADLLYWNPDEGKLYVLVYNGVSQGAKEIHYIRIASMLLHGVIYNMYHSFDRTVLYTAENEDSYLMFQIGFGSDLPESITFEDQDSDQRPITKEESAFDGKAIDGDSIGKFIISYSTHNGVKIVENTGFSAGDTVTIQTPPDWAGFNFVGWVSLNDGAIYQGGDTITMPSNHITLRGEWTATYHNLKYDGNGATYGYMSGEQRVEGFALNLAPNEYIRDNYEFLGWSLDKDATTPTWANNGTITLWQDTILYAIWGKDQTKTRDVTYTVKYTRDGVEVAGDTYTVTKQVWINEPADVTVAVDAISAANDRYDGYELADDFVAPTTAQDGDVITVAYNSVETPPVDPPVTPKPKPGSILKKIVTAVVNLLLCLLKAFGR